MAGTWYYAQDNRSFGPLAWEQLRQAAAAGQVRPTNIVWQQGMTEGVVASTVEYLFPAALAKPPPAATAPAVTAPPSAVRAKTLSPTPPLSAASPPPPTPAAAPGTPDQPPPQEQVRKRRAAGVKGAVVLSQDGVVVSFRKKCLKCGQEDSTRTTMPIRNGPMRAGFFCPKCRKLQPVEMQGVTA
jgi:hypothetical protein